MGMIRNTMENEILDFIKESGDVVGGLSSVSGKIEEISKLIIECYKNKKKVMLAGNGGSAAQATHIAAEFVGRYKLDREGLSAISLSTDLSSVTAIGNDYGFDKIFSRQVEAIGEEGDVLIVLSTSGNSENLINAVDSVEGINTVSLIGKDGGRLKGKAGIEIIINSNNTPKIQEAHLVILHIVCEIVEKKLFGENG
tara:strand:- start:3164 stop:3754 length:591 start_codon:yes stop_codon:yes gene_type:complete